MYTLLKVVCRRGSCDHYVSSIPSWVDLTKLKTDCTLSASLFLIKIKLTLHALKINHEMDKNIHIYLSSRFLFKLYLNSVIKLEAFFSFIINIAFIS